MANEKTFVGDLTGYWIGLVSGVGSFILMICSAVKETTVSASITWMGSYALLFVAAWGYTRGLRREIESLKSKRVLDHHAASVYNTLSYFRDEIGILLAYPNRPLDESVAALKKLDDRIVAYLGGFFPEMAARYEALHPAIASYVANTDGVDSFRRVCMERTSLLSEAISSFQQ